MLTLVHFRSNLVTHVALRQSTAVILRSHNLTISTSRTDSKQVTTMSSIQVYLLGKNVRRFADRTYYIVGVCGLVTGDVFYLMISLIESRSDEVSKTCINDGKLLDGAFFNI